MKTLLGGGMNRKEARAALRRHQERHPDPLPKDTFNYSAAFFVLAMTVMFIVRSCTH